MSRVKIDKKKVFKLINAVKACPHLWNTEHADYNNRFASAISWRNISISLEIPENVLRSKWRTLRDNYKKEVKKYKTTNVEDYNGKWKFFQALNFLNYECDYDKDSDENKNSVEFVVADEFTNHNYDEDTYEEETAESNSSMENYDVLFLKSLVPYFKKLDPVRKLIMRNRIQELLINELALQQNNSKQKCKT